MRIHFLVPAALWLGLAALPIIFFYYLRMRFRKQPISSIYLWSRLQSVVRGANRLSSRTILLLLLQLLTVIAATLAVAQPVWRISGHSKPGIIYLLDVSASMNARDVVENSKYSNRLEQAKALIKEQLTRQQQTVPGERQSECMIFSCSSGIVPLGDPAMNRDQLLDCLRTVFAGSAGFDETEVTEELRAWLLTHRKTDWQVVLVTDGGLDLGGKKLQSLFHGKLTAITVGYNGNHLGVTALRLLPGGGAQFQINNGWLIDQFTQVSLEFNHQTIARANLKVPCGISTQRLSFPGPLQTGIYMIQLGQKSKDDLNDSLHLDFDNKFYLALNPPRPVKVLFIGKDNPFLRAVLTSPQVDIQPPPGKEITAFPAAKNFNSEAWDLIVVDGVPIPYRFRCNLLAFGVAPPAKPDLLEDPMNGELQNVNTSHPLLRFTDWSHIQVTGGYGLQERPEIQVLATVKGRPMIGAFEEDGWHDVVFGTDLYHSDLGLSGAFPVFMQNMLQWCVPQANNQLAYTLTVGETKTIAEPPTWRINDAEDYIEIHRKGPLLTLKPLSPGVFNWEQGINRGILAANPPSSELNITPQPLHDIPLQSATFDPKAVNFTGEEAEFQVAFGSWALGLLLICLCAEWILWRGLPGRKG